MYHISLFFHCLQLYYAPLLFNWFSHSRAKYYKLITIIYLIDKNKKEHLKELKKNKNTYGSRKSGAILNMQSIKVVSIHHNAGFSAWLFTFNMRNRMHKITAIAVKNAVDIMIKNTISVGNLKHEHDTNKHFRYHNKKPKLLHTTIK